METKKGIIYYGYLYEDHGSKKHGFYTKNLNKHTGKYISIKISLKTALRFISEGSCVFDEESLDRMEKVLNGNPIEPKDVCIASTL